MSQGLGRGLSSLIPPKVNKNGDEPKDDLDIVSGASSAPTDDTDRVLKIEPDKIKVNPMQPRNSFSDYNMDELVESIKEHGIIQPLIVTKNDGEYELIAGERRLRAARSAGLEHVPVIVREAGEQKKLEIALVENLQREDLNPIETASAYKKLAQEFNLSNEEVAKRVGKSRPSVANTVRMLNLPEEIQAALIQKRIGEGHAKYLLGLDSEVKQMALFNKIVRSKLTVSATEMEARRMGGTRQARIKINYADKDKEFALREFFGTKVEVKRKGKGGQVILDFYSDEELDEIVEKVK